MLHNINNDFLQRYNITIRDANQPLILSKAKKKDIRGGQEQEVLLVPELCRATGITDEMRNNFRSILLNQRKIIILTLVLFLFSV